MISFFSRCALSVGAAGVLLAGCGGSQNMVSTSRPGAIFTQGGANKAAPSEGYLYVYEFGLGRIATLTYPGGKQVRTFRDTGRLCTDPNSGNLYVSTGPYIDEYTPGGSQNIQNVQLPFGYVGQGCAVDAATGNIVIAGSKKTGTSTSEAAVLVYSSLSQNPSIYSDSTKQYFAFAGYDNGGNLFVDTYSSLEELPKGGNTFTHISLTQQIINAGTVQWDGSYITVEAPDHRPRIYRVSVSGSVGTIIGEIKLGKRIFRAPAYSWINGNTVIAPWANSRKNAKIGYWSYPAGGKVPNRILAGFKYADTLVIGIK